METVATEADIDNLQGLTLKPSMEQWNAGSNEGSSDDSPPPPADAEREHPHHERRRRDAKPFEESPNFTETFGGKGRGKDEAEESPAKEKPHKAARSGEGNREEPDTKPRSKGTDEREGQDQEGEVEPEKYTKEDGEEDIEKLESPGQHGWRVIKGKLKENRIELKQTQAQVAAKEEELRAERQERLRIEEENRAHRAAREDPDQWPVTAKEKLAESHRNVAELEPYRNLYNVDHDEHFQRDYVEPVNNEFFGILQEACQKKGNAQEWVSWGNETLKAGPDSLTPEWWVNDFLPKFNDDPALKDHLTRRVSNLIAFQQQREHVRATLANSPRLHQRYVRERDQDYIQKYNQGMESIKEEAEKELGPWAKVPREEEIAAIEDPEQRQAALQHAEHFSKEVWPKFAKNVTDLNSKDPVARGRAHAYLAAKAVQADRLKRESAEKTLEMEKKLEQKELENEQLRKENHRLSKAHATVAQGGGVSGTRSRSREVDIFTDNPFKDGRAWDDRD